jgi:hypothetical protein
LARAESGFFARYKEYGAILKPLEEVVVVPEVPM